MSLSVISLFFIGVVRAVVGSFLNMLIYRLPRDMDIVFRPSHCPHCQTRLGVWELVPILSYLCQRGKCKTCQNPIAPRYVMVECLLTLLWTGLYWQFGLTLPFFEYALLSALFLALFFCDLEEMILPDTLTFLVIITGFFFGWLHHDFHNRFMGFMLGFLVYSLIGFVAKLIYKKDALGGGDVKLGAGIGAWLGFLPSILGIYLAFLMGALVSGFLLILKKKTRKEAIAFGPFMILAAALSLIFGQTLLHFYFNTMP